MSLNSWITVLAIKGYVSKNFVEIDEIAAPVPKAKTVSLGNWNVHILRFVFYALLCCFAYITGLC